MASTYKSKYTGEEIDALLDKANTALQENDISDITSKANSALQSSDIENIVAFFNKFTESDGELYFDGKKITTEVIDSSPEE